MSQAALISPVVPLLLKAADDPDGFDPAKFDRMTAELQADRPEFFHTYVKHPYGVGIMSSMARPIPMRRLSRPAARQHGIAGSRLIEYPGATYGLPITHRLAIDLANSLPNAGRSRAVLARA